MLHYFIALHSIVSNVKLVVSFQFSKRQLSYLSSTSIFCVEISIIYDLFFTNMFSLQSLVTIKTEKVHVQALQQQRLVTGAALFPCPATDTYDISDDLFLLK